MDTYRQLNQKTVSDCLARLDPSARDILAKYGPVVVLAGGYVRSVVEQLSSADVDLFVSGGREEAEKMAGELCGEWERVHVGLGDGASVAQYESGNAVTVRLLAQKRVLLTPPVQFCYRWSFSAPGELLDQFDFRICQAALWSDGRDWRSLAASLFYADVAERRLRYLRPQRDESPDDALLRVLKFYRRGYRIGLRDLSVACARLAGDESSAEDLYVRLKSVDRGSDAGDSAVLGD